MQTNKNGIPVQQKSDLTKKRGKTRRKPHFKLGQRTFVTTHDGIECKAVLLPDLEPVIDLLKSSGWREVHA